VFLVDGGGARQMVNFPRPLGDYGLPIPPGLPLGFPEDWVDVDRTVGNTTDGHQGATGPSIQGQVQNGVVTFNPANDTGADQQVLNIFFYNCSMHDFFYLLGFREGDGNFQQNNFGRGGFGGDSVDARSHPAAVFGTANMSRSVDGQSSIMNMGLVTSTNRHTAFDSTVVFHEFMHGVTTRLVGGPQNQNALNAPQSGGMGEGWGDYIACIINNVTVVGAWVVNTPGGIRGFPYDSNFPDDFGDLGTGRYTGVHNIGEIWCATLMEMTRNIGKNLALQLVVDALKLSPVNPSFLNMRDSILLALDDLRGAGQISASAHLTALRGIWRAFARFGMGPGAQSDGAQLTGIVADFNMPTLETVPTGIPAAHLLLLE
jgi:extracellular elastinolytic metalloproteinase